MQAYFIVNILVILFSDRKKRKINEEANLNILLAEQRLK